MSIVLLLIFNFKKIKQESGENLKKAWDILFWIHKKVTSEKSTSILLETFYHGVFKWCKFSLDLLAGGNFLRCDEAKALDIIDGLSSYFVCDHGIDAIIDRLPAIEKSIDALDLRKVEKPKPGRKEI